MSPFHFCLSAARDLSSFQLLPASLITDLLQLFFGLPLFLFPWGCQSRAAFGTSPSSFLNVWQIHLNFLFLISKFISSCPLTFHRSLLEIIFDHHILSIYLRHLFTKVCILRWISFVTNQVSHPYNSTDFTQALNILILTQKIIRSKIRETWRRKAYIFSQTLLHIYQVRRHHILKEIHFTMYLRYSQHTYLTPHCLGVHKTVFSLTRHRKCSNINI